MGQKAVTGEYGSCRTENHMVCRFAPPQIIIIHGRQIIMDKGIGMDAFQGAGSKHYCFRKSIVEILHRLCRRKAEDWSYPFAAGKKAVAHGIDMLSQRV